MEMRFSSLSFAKTRSQVGVLGIYENQRALTELPAQINKLLGGLITKTIREEKFKATPGEILVLYPHDKLPHNRLILVGLGKKTAHDISVVCLAAGAVAKTAKSIHMTNLLVHFPNFQGEKFTLDQTIQALTKGFILGSYSFNRYKKNNYAIIDRFCLTGVKSKDKSSAQKSFATAKIMTEATTFARDLINEPASTVTPLKLAEIAQDLAGPHLRVKIISQKDIEKLGMNAYLAVARGSDTPPLLIYLTYDPPHAKGHVTLIGKCITFDSGGLSLKTAESMENMKIDMSGGAMVLAIFQALSKLKPSIKVTGIIPAAENMPSGHASHPGDIVTAANGKTIEIANTDAEGRLTLADAIVYAQKEPTEAIIDLATLTGTAVSALGEKYNALFANDDHLAKKLLQSAETTGECLWRLPLVDDYKEMIKSDIADIKNITSQRWGGAITAALFIQEFVDKAPWAHIDLSAAWQSADTPLSRKGASASGILMILDYLQNYSNE